MSVRTYRPGDEDTLIAMFSSIFRERSPGEWDWLFRQGPHGPADIHLVEADGRVIGAVSHIPAGVWVAGERRELAIGCDAMVLAEYRRMRAAQLLFKTYYASDHGVDLNFGSVNASSARVTKSNMGTNAMGAALSWTRLRARAARRGSLRHRIAALLGPLYGALVTWPRPRLEVVDLEDMDAEIDRLAADSASYAPCVRIRDAAYLRWQWLASPMASWRGRAVRGPDGELRGIAISGTGRDPQPGVGKIVELVARDPAALRALVLDAWDLLTKAGADTVTCVYQDPRPWSRRAMLRCGFRSGPGTLLACGPLSPRVGELVGRLESWYLTGTDTEM